MTSEETIRDLQEQVSDYQNQISSLRRCNAEDFCALARVLGNEDPKDVRVSDLIDLARRLRDDCDKVDSLYKHQLNWRARDQTRLAQILGRDPYDPANTVDALLNVVESLRAALAWPEADPYSPDLVKRAQQIAADAATLHVERPMYAEASEARERIAAYLGLDGARFREISDRIERHQSSEGGVTL